MNVKLFEKYNGLLEVSHGSDKSRHRDSFVNCSSDELWVNTSTNKGIKYFGVFL